MRIYLLPTVFLFFFVSHCLASQDYFEPGSYVSHPLRSTNSSLSVNQDYADLFLAESVAAAYDYRRAHSILAKLWPKSESDVLLRTHISCALVTIHISDSTIYKHRYNAAYQPCLENKLEIVNWQTHYIALVSLTAKLLLKHKTEGPELRDLSETEWPNRSRRIYAGILDVAISVLKNEQSEELEEKMASLEDSLIDSGNKLDRVNGLKNIASFLSWMGKNEISLDVKQEAFLESIKSGESAAIAGMYISLATSYLSINELDEALQAAKNGLVESLKNEHIHLSLYASTVLIDIMLKAEKQAEISLFLSRVEALVTRYARYGVVENDIHQFENLKKNLSANDIQHPISKIQLKLTTPSALWENFTQPAS